MSNLQSYLRSLERFGATGLVLESGRNVILRFPSGDRHATQTTPHELLRQMVKAIAPASESGKLDANQSTSFHFEDMGKHYKVLLDASPSNWKVMIEPGAAPSTGVGDLPIERHQYNLPSSGDAGTPVGLAAAMPPVAAAAPEPAAAVEPAGGGGPASAIQPTQGDAWLDDLLRNMKEQGCSDLHLCTGCAPYLRLDGEMVQLEGWEKFSEEKLLNALMAVAPEENREEFKRRNDTDFAYPLPGVSRFRVNVFRDRNGPGGVFRAIPFEILSADKLGLPDKILDLCMLSKGLVVVTGPTGSGKSTTLAALIDHINVTRKTHIITIEDPVEFVHPNKQALINQREIGTHTDSFKDALRAALREDPDIVLVGEMRDLETIEIAVETAETGHLVFGTLHTTTAPSTVDRIIDQFPADRQDQIRQMLAESLMGVVAQVLCKKEGGGRAAAYEVLLGSKAVSNLIREKKTFQLFSLMQTNRAMGMRTMNDSLVELVKAGKVSANEAYIKAVNKDEIRGLLTRLGHQVGAE